MSASDVTSNYTTKKVQSTVLCLVWKIEMSAGTNFLLQFIVFAFQPLQIAGCSRTSSEAASAPCGGCFFSLFFRFDVRCFFLMFFLEPFMALL